MTVWFLGLLVASQGIPTSYAGELAYALGYFGEYSDNIRRVPANPQSEWANSLITGLAYRENGPALDANLLAQAEYRDYKNNIYSDGPLYYADASLLWRVLPQRLNWVLVDRYDQITRDVTRSDTPDNRVNSNVFSTGPDLYMRLGQVNTLVFGLRYGNASYNDVDLDNNRYGASARWQYAANTETTYSLNYEAEQVKYNNGSLNDNLMRNDFFIRADRRQARARFQLDLGTSRIDRDRAGKNTGFLARLGWAQQLTSESSTGILIAAEYLDAGTALLSTATDPTLAPGASSSGSTAGEVTNDFFYTKRAELYYIRKGSSFGLKTRAYYRNIEYTVLPQDRRETGGQLEVSYNPFSLLTATMYASYLGTNYLIFDRDDRESEIGIRFQYRINRTLSAILDGRETWRSSTDASQEYTDRRLLFSLQYASSPSFGLVRR